MNKLNYLILRIKSATIYLMKYYYLKEKEKNELKVNRIKVAYPKVKFLYSYNEIVNKVKQGDTLIFDNVLELDEHQKNDFNQIKENYKKLINKNIDLIFNKSSNCDSEIIKEYVERFSALTNKEDIFDLMFEMQYESWINLQSSDEAERHYTRIVSRKEGKFVGRPQGSLKDSEQAIRAKEIIKKNSKAFGGNLSDDECMKLTGVSRSMYYTYKRRLKEEEKK